MLAVVITSLLIFLFLYNYVQIYIALLIAAVPLLLVVYRNTALETFLHLNRKMITYEIDLDEDQIELLTIAVNKIQEHSESKVALISTFSNLYLIILTPNVALIENMIKAFSADTGINFRKIRARLTCIKGLMRGGKDDKDTSQALKKAKYSWK